MRTVVVGATGAVGTQMMRILEERGWPAEDLVPVASARSAGRRIAYGDAMLEVELLRPEVFDGAGLALFDVPDDVALEWAPVAAAKSVIVIDNSAAFRMDEDVPLVVPEINPTEVDRRPRGIVASPNCTTLTTVVPVAALHRAAPLRRLVLASYQAVSGSGQGGMDELWEQVQLAAKQPEDIREGRGADVLRGGSVFTEPIAMNVVPQCGSFKDDGYTSEELKLCFESRKILGLSQLPVTATCVRVPVMVGHSVAIHAEFERPLPASEARAVLEAAQGVEVVDDPTTHEYPTPLRAAGRDPCYVGRIRQDLHDPYGLELFSVADNLRKGAALNTVQIAELLLH